MNYGLYLSASGALSAMHRLDVAANNLANVSTTAFKPDIAVGAQRDAARIEDGLFHIDSNTLLEQLGGGALSAPTITNFTPAAPEITGNPLDVAILGEGFFALGGAEEGLNLSRDGRFTLDERGRLQTATTGLPVLGANDRPIFVDPEIDVEISSRGEVIQNDRVIGRIQIVSVPDRRQLAKAGENLFYATPQVAETRFATGSFVEPGSLESSGVDPIMALKSVTDAGADARNSLRLMEIHDQLMDRAINSFGRVA